MKFLPLTVALALASSQVDARIARDLRQDGALLTSNVSAKPSRRKLQNPPCEANFCPSGVTRPHAFALSLEDGRTCMDYESELAYGGEISPEQCLDLADFGNEACCPPPCDADFCPSGVTRPHAFALSLEDGRTCMDYEHELLINGDISPMQCLDLAEFGNQACCPPPCDADFCPSGVTRLYAFALSAEDGRSCMDYEHELLMNGDISPEQCLDLADFGNEACCPPPCNADFCPSGVTRLYAFALSAEDGRSCMDMEHELLINGDISTEECAYLAEFGNSVCCPPQTRGKPRHHSQRFKTEVVANTRTVGTEEARSHTKHTVEAQGRQEGSKPRTKSRTKVGTKETQERDFYDNDLRYVSSYVH